MTEKKYNENETKKNAIRNVLLVGRTGNGKSTLANVLTNTENFKESSNNVSETRTIQAEDFILKLNEEEIIYKVIDTIGIGDTKLSDKEVLRKISTVSHYLKDNGLCQILFVTNGKFTKEEIETYNVMKQVLFGDEITKYTTIVRTNFDKFEDKESCEKATIQTHEENPILSEILRNCNGIIYVNNPSVDEKQRPRAINLAKELRDESRKILIEHLTYKCGNYYPTKISQLNERIESYMTEKEKLQKRLEEEQMEKEAIRKRVEELECKVEEAAKETLNWRQRAESFHCRIS